MTLTRIFVYIDVQFSKSSRLKALFFATSALFLTLLPQSRLTFFRKGRSLSMTWNLEKLVRCNNSSIPAIWRPKWRRPISDFNRSCILTNPLRIMTIYAPKWNKITVLSLDIFYIDTKKWHVPLISNYHAVSEFSHLPRPTRSPNFNFEIRPLKFSTAITVQAVYSRLYSFFVNVHMREIDNGTKRQETKRAHNNGTREAWSSDAILAISRTGENLTKTYNLWYYTSI